ncbi:MAG: hypothetical protein JSV88_22150 [Candidatus Aminicenantes bacterium]|nr:MAG: hypothetical protein JSV88_22150 [Candidatus Aminicenantes bacterium]
MTAEPSNVYDVETCNSLKEKFLDQKLHRPMKVGRYDAGTRLSYEITGVSQPHQARIHLEIEKFVGGGFAGQVYKVKILDIETINGSIDGIEKNRVYAIKIMIPPSGFSRFFRSLVYRIGFQGPFQLQVNPTAVQAGAIWQKFIRRGAKVRFGDETTVNDIHATFVDTTLGSCGEISDWVDGRTWRLEVDEWMDLLKRFKRNKLENHENLGSPEYRAKKKFMKEFVKLLNDMGAHEFARQYEWSTCKSQPNCLKHKETENNPASGLIAIDFRAGLALLPFLPMSPGDFMLIFKGIARGSLVQFDRGNLKKLEKFIETHKEDFKDILPLLEELKTCEQVYRNSIPDITHNHFRLLSSKKLWATILKSLRVSWRVRNKIDHPNEQKLSKSAILTLIFSLLGIIPFLGSFIRKLWARPDWRKHYASMLTRWTYLKRSIRGKCLEKAVAWNRAERVNSRKAQRIAGSFFRYLLHLPLSILPAGLHRLFTDWQYFKGRLYYLLVRPIKLYFSAPLREQWLRDMLARGKEKHMLTHEDAQIINSQIKEPFIQKYLQSLAVHVCTLPVTQIVSILVSWIYVRMHPELSTAEAMAAVAAILVLFQITPISPGSLVRGLYVVYMMIKDRSFKDYNIAVFLGFFKYIGYLAFPIQMTYKYPELARFMAGHWATEAVHIVPVFGEPGALLEHWVFGLFYNWPLTVRRRMHSRARFRAALPPRYWHVLFYAVGAAAVLGAADFLFMKYTGIAPGLKHTWWFALLITFLCGAGVTLGCGGAALSKRIVSAAIWGILTSLLYTAVSALLIQKGNIIPNELAVTAAWRMFIFTLLGTIAAMITELRLPDPNIKAWKR